MHIKIAPSLLAADFSRLAEQIAIVEAEADMLHLDIMDGHFVPNISFGMPVISSIRTVTDLPFDCHVMTTNPDDFLEEFREAGADLVTMHVEAMPRPTEAFRVARSLELRVGLVISPHTPFEAIEPFVEQCDQIVVMAVRPGFGGQSFMPEVLPKLEQARKWVDSHGLETDVEIDGGVTPDTAPRAVAAGANVLVAGSAVFRENDPTAAIRRLRNVTGETR